MRVHLLLRNGLAVEALLQGVERRDAFTVLPPHQQFTIQRALETHRGQHVREGVGDVVPRPRIDAPHAAF